MIRQHLFASIAFLALISCGSDTVNSPDPGESSSQSSSTDIPLSQGASESTPSSGQIISSADIPVSMAMSGATSSSNLVPSSSSSNGAQPSSSGTAVSSSGVIPLSSTGTITSFTDPRDGQVYPVVTIGTQVWFAKNLNVGTMVTWSGDDMDFILSVDDSKIEKLCYGNDPTSCDKYGGLYQWFEAMQYPAKCSDYNLWNAKPPTECPHGNLPTGKRGICPVGWHIPDTTEFNVLYKYVRDHGYNGGVNVALRSTTFLNGLDSFGFNVIGGGYWFSSWFKTGKEGYMWSSTVYQTVNPLYENWDNNDDFLVVHNIDLTFYEALSIRCLQD